jgi:carboxypeptidase C (cathepsin A)
MKPYRQAILLAVLGLSLAVVAQQDKTPPPERGQKDTAAEKMARPAPPKEQPSPSSAAEAGEGEKAQKALHFDMTEVAPVVTHHEMKSGGKILHYTATTGRLPIKAANGTIEAEMFFVAYTLDGSGADPSHRPLTFAFNGGPGSASIWLHMGILGPRRVVLSPEGFLPAPPYRLEDNPYTPLDATDLVLVDAIGTGYSRPADPEQAKKFWNVNGDIAAFGEFIRMYISRYERWSSPLYLLGESYGTTRAAGVSGYLSDKGIYFNGIDLLSTVLSFETLIFTKTNDVPYPLLIPSYAMVAAYHKKLAPELMLDLPKTRAEAERWAATEYWPALNKGDALTPEEHNSILDGLARYTGLPKPILDQANLRVDVDQFTHYLLADQKLRVGRLDGRYAGPDPIGYMDETPGFFDPTATNTEAPLTSVFNDYVRRDLGYKVDMPYYTLAQEYEKNFKWSWNQGGPGDDDPMGFPDTATALRGALVKNRWLKVLVMEGYYDLATPYFAANYTMDHLNLSPEYRKNISYATYDSGHMVYLRNESAEKMKKDFVGFVKGTQ